MIDKIKLLNIKKVDYEDILQVAELFYADRVSQTIFNAMAFAVNFNIEQKEKDGKAFSMMIHTGLYEAFNMEYNLLIKALSMNYTEETQKRFLMDFSIKSGVREESNMRGPLFLCGAILRKYLRLLTEIKSYAFKKDGGSFNVVNFYTPVIYEKEDIAKQMSAITIRLDVLVELISAIEGSGALYKAMEYCYGDVVEYKQVAFGVKQCNFFWVNSGKSKATLYKTF